jgi:hypothetical protein
VKGFKAKGFKGPRGRGEEGKKGRREEGQKGRKGGSKLSARLGMGGERAGVVGLSLDVRQRPRLLVKSL